MAEGGDGRFQDVMKHALQHDDVRNRLRPRSPGGRLKNPAGPVSRHPFVTVPPSLFAPGLLAPGRFRSPLFVAAVALLLGAAFVARAASAAGGNVVQSVAVAGALGIIAVATV